MNKYTVNIRNLYENKHRTLEVKAANVQNAHKDAFFNSIKRDEEIVSMFDSDDVRVFDKSEGFVRD